jgi:hypothetical protein
MVQERNAEVAEAQWVPRPFLPPTPEEMAWLMQYVSVMNEAAFRESPAARYCGEYTGSIDRNKRLRRHKFIIFDGETGCGKTERAVWWFGAGQVLAVNCKDVTTPNLRDWASGKHIAIVFDEGAWKLVAENRALFQASTRMIQLAQSNCNGLSYAVRCHQTPMIVTSNDFWKDCHDWEAWHWITQNSVYIKVTKPLFEQNDHEGDDEDGEGSS